VADERGIEFTAVDAGRGQRMPGIVDLAGLARLFTVEMPLQQVRSAVVDLKPGEKEMQTVEMVRFRTGIIGIGLFAHGAKMEVPPGHIKHYR
jgi:hypothetical protein